jgi:DNA-binding NtrC family response regulator
MGQNVTQLRFSMTVPPPGLLEPRTILLVDDDDPLRGMCRSLLEECGYRVLEADNGLEALLLAVECKGAFDLVITDFAMPQMNGAELGRVFGEMWPGMSVLYMSGSPRESVGDELPAGCAFLKKPFDPDGLMLAVGGVLEQREKGAA